MYLLFLLFISLHDLHFLIVVYYSHQAAYENEKCLFSVVQSTSDVDPSEIFQQTLESGKWKPNKSMTSRGSRVAEPYDEKDDL